LSRPKYLLGRDNRFQYCVRVWMLVEVTLKVEVGNVSTTVQEYGLLFGQEGKVWLVRPALSALKVAVLNVFAGKV